MVHASICPAAAGAAQLADIDAVFATLQLRIYDAQGNLRAPPTQEAKPPRATSGRRPSGRANPSRRRCPSRRPNGGGRR